MEIQGLAKTFVRQAQDTPERLFAITEEGKLTFGALSGAADAMIAKLIDAGARPGDHVAVMMRNSPASLALVYGLMRCGMVWVPVNPALVSDGLAHAITLAEASIVVCDQEFETVLEQCDVSLRLGIMALTDTSLPSAPDKAWSGPLPAPDSLASIMFTSGTTGPAKGVRVTHTMLELAVNGVALVAGLRPGDNMFMWEPFYHVGGAQVILTPILYDITLTIADRFSASRFWDQVREAGCTHIHHLGGILQILLKQPPSELDKSHDVRIAWGGGCVETAWRPFEERFGVEIRECYGMTEASSISAYNDQGVVGAVGHTLPWFDIKIKDENGNILRENEGRGEIVITSPISGAIFDGYYRAPEPTAKALQEDGFHTGDMGSWGADGLLRFHGRMSDSIRCRGENVSAFEVESVVNRHPDVEESAMVGVPAEIGEYDIQLFVRLREGASLDAEGLSDWLAERLAVYQQPRFIAFLDSFPKTPSQRIRKQLLPKEPDGRWERTPKSKRGS